MSKKTMGRPKLPVKSWRELLKEFAEKRDSNGKTYREAIIRTLLVKAKNGEQWAIKEVLDRIEGKAVQLQQTDITSGGEALGATVNFVDSATTLGPAPVVPELEAEAVEVETDGGATPFENKNGDECDT